MQNALIVMVWGIKNEGIVKNRERKQIRKDDTSNELMSRQEQLMITVLSLLQIIACIVATLVIHHLAI